MVLQTFYWVDIENNSKDEELRMAAKVFLEVNTPIVKAYCSDMSLQCISEALQCYGGYGFSEEYPIAEYYRDARIYPIWEGTNYIQSLDLVGRKMTMKKGAVFAAWLKYIEDLALAGNETIGLEGEISLFLDAIGKYKEALKLFTEISSIPGMVQLYATRMLHTTGKLWAAKILLEMALVSQKKLDDLGGDHFEANFYKGKIASARFFVKNILPEIGAFAEVLRIGDDTAVRTGDEIFV